MTYETILYEVADRIATITFNRPEQLNAVNEQMIGELNDAYTRAEGDDDVWTLIVTATGRAFCAGADVEKIPEDGKVSARRSVPLAVQAVGGAPGGDAAVPHDGEADRGGGQRPLLRRRDGPGDHR